MANKRLVRIEVEVPPNKTTYFEGDIFNPLGMVVRAYYSDLSNEIITHYDYPLTPLTLADHYVTISYFDKTATCLIKVITHFPLASIKSADIGNNPFYNLFDQSVRFISETVSVSRDSYALDFNLIYHSRMVDKISQLCLGLPKKFKTNYHQFLLKDGYDQNSQFIYKYVDAYGYTHPFYKVDTRLYYSSNNNLYLVFGDSNSNYYAKIIDEQNNQLFFNSSGVLYQIIDGRDNTNIKVISFSNNKINSVVDQRDVNTSIQFSYNNDKLTNVSFIYQNTLIKSLVFNYDNSDFLTSMDESLPNNQTRALYTFSYNSNGSSYDHIDLIQDHLGHKAYRFHYVNDTLYNDYLVDAFISGLISSNNTFISKNSLTRVSYSYRNDDYNTVSEIKLVNQDYKQFAFSIDSNAKITASFGNDSLNYYQTLYKENGIHLPLDNGTGVYINTHPLKNVASSYTFTLSSSVISLLNDYKNFVLRFYLKLNTNIYKRIRASISANAMSLIISSSVDINVFQNDKYQLVEIPFIKLFSSGSSLTSLTISIKNENGNFVNVDIGDVYLDKSSCSLLMFKGGQYSFDNVTSIGIYDQYYQSEPVRTIDVTGEISFTVNDFIKTFKHQNNCFSLAYSDVYQNMTHPIYLNNGQSFDLYHFRFTLFVGNTVVFDSFNPGNDDLDASANTWFLVTSSPDNKSVSLTYYRYTNSYYEIVTRTTYDNEPISWKEEINRYDAYLERLMKVTNSHSIGNAILTSETNYEYYSNGELKKITQISNNETIVLFDSSQNSNGYIVRKTSGLLSNDISYNNYLESIIVHNQVDNGVISNSTYKKELSYDDYSTVLIDIAFKQGTTNRGTNHTNIDYLNNELTLSINSSPIYKIVNDLSTDTSTLKRYNGVSYNDVLTTKQTNTMNEITYYDATTNITIKDSIDAYGRDTYQTLNNQAKVTFGYETNIEHPSVSRIASVVDDYINKTTTYTYDEAGNSVSFTNDDYFTIYRDKYGFSAYYFTDEAHYYSNDLYYKLKIYINNNISKAFSIEYYYDPHNRISEKARVYENNNDYQSYLKDSFNYIVGTVLPSSFVHTDIINNYNHVSQTYTYDHFGNISSIITTFRDVGVSSIINLLYTRSFEYDGFNRLTQETNDFVTSFSRAYSYNDKGRLSVFGGNSLIYNSSGQLSSFGSFSYEYDNYGNRVATKIGDDVIISYLYSRGKLLSSTTSNGKTTTFTYDHLGRRYQKDTYKETVTYFYDGNKLIGENHVGKTYLDENNVQQVGVSFQLRFFYHSDGTLNGLRLIYIYNNQTYKKDYAYIVNAYHEIVGLSLINTSLSTPSSTLEVNYIYDAWGNHKVYNSLGQESCDPLFIGYLNPFRFKGYYYDQETGLYYLLSRYYDCSIGQFISPDDIEYLSIDNISGIHLYAYCQNNPVMNYDPSGHSFLGLLALVLCPIPVVSIAFAVETAVETAYGVVNDIIQFASGNTNSKKPGEITNSAKIINPLSKLVYLVYHKYFDKNSSIKGSVIGALFEWECHNAAYELFSAFDSVTASLGFHFKFVQDGIESAKNVNLGSSIFTDTGHDFGGEAMKVAYMAACVATGYIGLIFFDLLFGGGWKK